MSSVIFIGKHPFSTILMHQPYDGAGAASANFYGVLDVEQVVTRTLQFFGVHIDADTVRKTDIGARPAEVAQRGLSYSYAVKGERCHADDCCRFMPVQEHATDLLPDFLVRDAH